MLYTETFQRDYETMVEEAIDRLRDKTGLTDFSSGSIARSLVEVYYEDMEYLHKRLSFSMAMSFVSSAEGPYLDEIAKLFDMEREAGESDENFRYRITHATQTLAKANKVAVRLACLSVDGVYEVEMKKFARGAGSFDIYIVTEEPTASEETITSVQEQIEEIEAFGVDGNVLVPEPIQTDLEVFVAFYDGTSSEEKGSLKNEVSNTLSQYINNRNMGEGLIITQLIDTVMDIDQKAIKDMDIISLYIDGEETVVGNKEIYWDQRLVPGNIIIN